MEYFSASTTGHILKEMPHWWDRVTGRFRLRQEINCPLFISSFQPFGVCWRVHWIISCTSTNRLKTQTQSIVHSNFSHFKTETIPIFHMRRGQHPACFYSKSPSIGIHGNRWVAFSHPCGDIDHWLTLKYECLLSVDTWIEMSCDIYWSTSLHL